MRPPLDSSNGSRLVLLGFAVPKPDRKWKGVCCFLIILISGLDFE